MKRTTVVLSALAGAALFEAALVPSVLIGGAAVLAPKLLPGLLPRFFATAKKHAGHSGRGSLVAQ